MQVPYFDLSTMHFKVEIQFTGALASIVPKSLYTSGLLLPGRKITAQWAPALTLLFPVSRGDLGRVIMSGIRHASHHART